LQAGATTTDIAPATEMSRRDIFWNVETEADKRIGVRHLDRIERERPSRSLVRKQHKPWRSRQATTVINVHRPSVHRVSATAGMFG
jgi:hypothetical protein